jgi:dienelactone hydrolase
MSQIALFHSVLGVRPGVLDAGERMRAAGHEVLVIDQYDGRAFDDYDQASAYAGAVGYPALMQRALAAVEQLHDGFIAMGFSNGGAMAEYVATRRRVAGVIMLSGVMPLDMLGASGWPVGVPAQIHYAIDDPFRDQGAIDAVAASIRATGAPLAAFDYPGKGHLFTDDDVSLSDEYDEESAVTLWRRVLDFCSAPTGTVTA